MKAIEDIFKNAKFTDEAHKARLYTRLFDEKVIDYIDYNGGNNMADEKKVMNTDVNELSDDALDDAAGGFQGGAIAAELVLRKIAGQTESDRVATNTVYKPQPEGTTGYYSGGKTTIQRKGDGTTIC